MHPVSFVLVLMVVSLAPCLAKQYCTMDDDCSNLGSLRCIKSYCDRGVCSCPHGEAAKFINSADMYKCVPIRKVDESCSNTDATGVCGAKNSECSITNEDKDYKCRCSVGLVSLADGHVCDIPGRVFEGETCSTNSGFDNCYRSTCTNMETGTQWSIDVNYGKPTCACREDQELAFSNTYYDDNTIQADPFLDRKQPICIPKKFGSSCERNSDCPTGMSCTSDKCECTTAGRVPNYMGSGCGISVAFGGDCTANTCNGQLGLECDDDYRCTAVATAGNPKCVCGPFHVTSGNTCTARTEGSACFGDYNCKGWSASARCVDGTCRSSAGRLVATMTAIILSILVTYV